MRRGSAYKVVDEAFPRTRTARDWVGRPLRHPVATPRKGRLTILPTAPCRARTLGLPSAARPPRSRLRGLGHGGTGPALPAVRVSRQLQPRAHHRFATIVAVLANGSFNSVYIVLVKMFTCAGNISIRLYRSELVNRRSEEK